MLGSKLKAGRLLSEPPGSKSVRSSSQSLPAVSTNHSGFVARRIGRDAEILERVVRDRGRRAQLALVHRARRERHDLLVHAVLLLEHHARRAARDQPLEDGGAERGLELRAAGDDRAELVRIAGEHGDLRARERDEQQRIGGLRRLVDDRAVEDPVSPRIG